MPDSTMSTKETKEPREPKEPEKPRESKDSKEPKHRVDALRQPQRKDSFTSVLTYLQGRSLPPKASSTTSSTLAQSPPAATAQALSKPRRHSHSTDVKKKARKNSTILRTSPIAYLAGIQEDSGTKTKTSKTPEGNPKTTRSGSSEKLNKTPRDAGDMRKKKSQSQLAAGAQDIKPKSPPPPMPKSILRVASPDGTRPPPRHIRSLSASAAIPSPGELANITGLTPICGEDPDNAPSDSGSASQPSSPVVRPLSPGATVRFAKATIHRVDVGPGRRFAPVKRRSKSTVTYLSPLDPVSQQNTPKLGIQSPTKLRRHQENQAAMGRYWQRTEEEEAQWRAEAERRAAQEAERYRAEPPRPPGTPAPTSGTPGSPIVAGSENVKTQETSLDEILPTAGGLPTPLDSIPLFGKVESFARSDADDKLETVEAEDSDDSDADSDGGASTALDDGEGDEVSGKTAEEKRETSPPTGSGQTKVVEDGKTAQQESEMGPERSSAVKTAAEKIAVKSATILPASAPHNPGMNNATSKQAEPLAPNPKVEPKSGILAGDSAMVGTHKPATKVVATAAISKAETPPAQAKQQPPVAIQTAISTSPPATGAAPAKPTPLANPTVKNIMTGVTPALLLKSPAPLNTAHAATPAAISHKQHLTLSPSTSSAFHAKDRPLSPSPTSPRPMSPRPMSPGAMSPRPSSPLPTLRHKPTMASMALGPIQGNHLHLSGRRSRRYSIGADHKQEIVA